MLDVVCGVVPGANEHFDEKVGSCCGRGDVDEKSRLLVQPTAPAYLAVQQYVHDDDNMSVSCRIEAAAKCMETLQ